MLVRTVIRSVCCRARAATVKGSWMVSETWVASNPRRAARAAHGPISPGPIAAGAEVTNCIVADAIALTNLPQRLSPDRWTPVSPLLRPGHPTDVGADLRD